MRESAAVRKSSNWLQTLLECVEETESPRHFWIWSGIYCLCSALQRRCWLEYGIDPIYPNIYVLIVAPPGYCRKGPPVGFAKKLLLSEGIQIPVFVDSPTKRALTKTLAEVSQTSGFNYVDPKTRKSEWRSQAPLSIVSKELSSFLAVNNKEMIEVLTDLYDPHDVWEYLTSGEGKDEIYGPCISAFFASTPGWISENLPLGAVGGGWTSRIIVAYADQKYKFVPIPPLLPESLYQTLIHDLSIVKTLRGPFVWGEGAEAHFRKWYETIEDHIRLTHDDRVKAYLARIHIHVIKVSMAVTVSQSNELVITEPNLMTAIHLCEQVIEQAPKAYGALGRSQTALITDEVRRQVRVMREVTFGELFKINYKNTNRSDLKEAIYGLQDMGQVEISQSMDLKTGKEELKIKWVGKK